MFYEHNNEYTPLRIILKDVVGYYNVYKNNSKYYVKYSAKKMNLRFSNDDDSLDNVYGIFNHIEEKLNIDLSSYIYEDSKGEKYLKTIISDETCFRKNKDNIIPDENTKYSCRALLQIQSVYFNMKDNKEDIECYPQVLLEQCGYRPFSNNVLFHKDLEFTDTEPDSESEEDINEDTMFNE